MVALPAMNADPTLAAADRALEEKENAQERRGYLGMSSIGKECERASWFDFRWITRAKFDAEALKRFADGHHGEDVQAARLRLVPGITLHTHTEDGEQFGFSDNTGHFRGHMDGAILGLLQAPATWHVWEHKQVGEKKQAKLASLKAKMGEKQALAEWDAVYHAQAMLYCHYSGMDRHYLTCSTPGGRSTISVRTDKDSDFALRLIAKAERIITSANPPARPYNDPSFYVCKWCQHSDVCWGEKLPDRTCRSCIHSEPIAEGEWTCNLADASRIIDRADQEEGCPSHLLIPSLVAGEQVDACEHGTWIEYKMKDGRVWRDEVVS